MEEAIENIRVRAAIRAALVARSRESEEFLRPSWVARANAAYWSLVEDGHEGSDLMDAWTTWFAGVPHG
jgi:hypothetical protein